MPRVVSYRNSTSNHNGCALTIRVCMLYLIEIPHQTTTLLAEIGVIRSCILSKFHIKPQLQTLAQKTMEGCILSKFHIKPQHTASGVTTATVVSYRNSTSNHNGSAAAGAALELYLIEIPHQTTTVGSPNRPPL